MKPVIDDFLNLSYPVDAKISPNGCRVAYTVRITNWRDNRYENFCYVFEVANNVTTQLTKTGSVTQIRWINDNDVVVLKNNFDDKKPQVWLYQGLMGDGLQLTEHPGGVEAFEAFGEGIIYLANDSERKESRERRESLPRISLWSMNLP